MGNYAIKAIQAHASPARELIRALDPNRKVPYQSIADLTNVLRTACSGVASRFVWPSGDLSSQKYSELALCKLPPGDMLSAENAGEMPGN